MIFQFPIDCDGELCPDPLTLTAEQSRLTMEVLGIALDDLETLIRLQQEAYAEARKKAEAYLKYLLSLQHNTYMEVSGTVDTYLQTLLDEQKVLNELAFPGILDTFKQGGLDTTGSSDPGSGGQEFVEFGSTTAAQTQQQSASPITVGNGTVSYPDDETELPPGVVEILLTQPAGSQPTSPPPSPAPKPDPALEYTPLVNKPEQQYESQSQTPGVPTDIHPGSAPIPTAPEPIIPLGMAPIPAGPPPVYSTGMAQLPASLQPIPPKPPPPGRPGPTPAGTCVPPVGPTCFLVVGTPCDFNPPVPAGFADPNTVHDEPEAPLVDPKPQPFDNPDEWAWIEEMLIAAGIEL